jgi:hypothetical protein
MSTCDTCAHACRSTGRGWCPNWLSHAEAAANARKIDARWTAYEGGITVAKEKPTLTAAEIRGLAKKNHKEFL